MAKPTSQQFISWSAAPTLSAYTGTSKSFNLEASVKNPKHLTLSFALALGYSYPTGWSQGVGADSKSVYWNGGGSTVPRTDLKWVVSASGQQDVPSPAGWVETLSAPVVLPVQPINVLAEAVSTSQIDISWSPGSGGTAPTSYKLYHSTSGLAGSYTLLSASATSPHSHSGLAAGSYHKYYVVAVNSSGESQPSLADDATTFPGNPQPVVSITAAALSDDEVRIEWIPSMTAPLAESYLVRFDTTPTNPLPQVAEVFEPTRFHIVSGLEPSTWYDAVVRAVAGGLESVNSTRVTVVTNAPAKPSTPTAVAATAQSSSAIALEWMPGSGGSAATDYKIYHSTTQGGPYTVIATVADADVNIDDHCAYLHENLASASTHYYRVAGVDTNGEGEKSFEVSATTDADFPAVPVSVVATGISSTAIRVTWERGTGGSPVQYFRIYRGDTAESNFAQIGETAGLTFDDETLTAGQTKYYRVRAFDAEGDSKVSATVSGTAQAAAVPGIPINVSAVALSATSVRVAWSPGAGATPTGYNVYRATAQSGPFTTPVATNDAASPFDNTGLTAGTTYYFCLTALDSGQSFESEKSVVVPVTTSSTTAPDTTPPSAPVLSVKQVSGVQVTLQWTASSDPTVAGQERTGVAFYDLYRGGVKVDQVSEGTLVWVDPAELDPATGYQYKVRARDGAGNTTFSNEVTATTGSVKYGWNDGFQSGTIEPIWKTNTSGGTLAVVTDPIVGGSAKVVRCQVDRTDHNDSTWNQSHYRAETLTDLEPTFPQFRKEVWYGWRTLFPAGWVSDPQWCIVMQCHGRFVPNNVTLNPALAFYLNGFTIKAVGRSWDGVAADSTQVFGPVIGTIGGNITAGAWTAFVMRIVWNWDNSGSVPGQCQIWVNGTAQMNYTGKFGYKNINPNTGQPITPEWRAGLYMSKQDAAADIIRTIYHDSFRAAHTHEGGSYTAVDPSGNTP